MLIWATALIGQALSSPFDYNSNIADAHSSLVDRITSMTCAETAPDWLRQSFHDAGTWNPFSRTGGAAGGLINFLNLTVNGGFVLENMAPAIIGASLTAADSISLGGLHAVASCGGPNFEWQAGREDVLPPVSSQVLPDALDSYEANMTKMRAMGFTDEEIVLIVTGGHTFGYV
jgi:catalase (peroxidase I)